MKENLAETLADRWGIPKRGIKIIEAWIKDRQITRIIDLRKYGKNHADAMNNALNDLWNYATEGA
jgi:hypothetical protein